jgi:hypothetical protein
MGGDRRRCLHAHRERSLFRIGRAMKLGAGPMRSDALLVDMEETKQNRDPKQVAVFIVETAIYGSPPRQRRTI